jgi:hypothetical protein
LKVPQGYEKDYGVIESFITSVVNQTNFIEKHPASAELSLKQVKGKTIAVVKDQQGKTIIKEVLYPKPRKNVLQSPIAYLAGRFEQLKTRTLQIPSKRTILNQEQEKINKVQQ